MTAVPLCSSFMGNCSFNKSNQHIEIITKSIYEGHTGSISFDADLLTQCITNYVFCHGSGCQFYVVRGKEVSIRTTLEQLVVDYETKPAVCIPDLW